MSKNLEEQKAEELWYFNYFRKCYGKTLPDPDPDHIGEPDFLIKIDGKIVGIELTEYNNEEVMENISVRQRTTDFAEKTCNQLLADNPKPLGGFITIDYRHDFFLEKKRKCNTKTIAQRIASMVYNDIETFQNQSDHYENWKILKKYDLEDSLDVVYFQPDINSNRLFWNCTYNAFRAGNLGNQQTKDGIMRTINKKNKLHHEYLKVCSECWLLIHHVVHKSLVDFDDHSVEIEETYRNLLKDSPFSKIVFMTTGGKHQLVWFKNSLEVLNQEF